MDQPRSKRCLIIDLTNDHYEKIEIKPEITTSYPSGIALATHLLRSILPPGTDPLSPNNVMVFAPGMFAGTPYPGATRIAVVSKSPLTGLWTGGTMGGKFAWVLSQTGWDAVVIQGKALKLSYLLLDEGRVFFRSAKDLKGNSCSVCRKKLTEIWGEGESILCIGPAGESRVKFSTLEDGSHEAPLRGGLGAIFGAKNLKALVVRPDAPQKTEKAGEFLDAVLPMIRELTKTEPDPFLEMGAINVLKKLNSVCALPSRNFQTAGFSEDWFDSLENIDTQKRSCPGCPVACLEVLVPKADSQSSKNVIKIPLNPEPLWAMGPLLELMDMDECLGALRACDEYGVDPISFGILAAWMAECHEKKIKLGIVEDLVPEFGNGFWLTGLPEKIAEDEDVRGFLGQGIFRAAEQTGPVSQAFAMHFSGQELSFIDPRRGFGSLSFLGPAVWMPQEHHLLESEPQLGEDWIFNSIQGENFWALLESIGICKWVGLALVNTPILSSFEGRVGVDYPAPVQEEGEEKNSLSNPDRFYENLSFFAQLISENNDSKELVKGLGERCVNLIQAFNWREGWRPGNSILPKRFIDEDLVTSKQVYPALDAESWQASMGKYFSTRNWTREGNPGKI